MLHNAEDPDIPLQTPAFTQALHALTLREGLEKEGATPPHFNSIYV